MTIMVTIKNDDTREEAIIKVSVVDDHNDNITNVTEYALPANSSIQLPLYGRRSFIIAKKNPDFE